MHKISLGNKRSICFFIVLLTSFLTGVLQSQALAAKEDLAVLGTWRMYSDAPNLLYKSIVEQGYEFLGQRSDKLSGISTEEGWLDYRNSVSSKLAQAFGPLPEKTPLNARTTGEFEHEGIKVEKILFESRPGFLVSASFFKLAGAAGRLPAILYVCGHTGDGFKSSAYQKIILNFAKKGFAVLAIDPVGQGERLQYYDPALNKSIVGGPTHEHSYAGLLYLALGRTMAMVRLWDGIRAVDYLLERQDVDPKRIGVQGRSGGGTMSAYLGAMDKRITAAAPECYISSFKRILQSMGPQDAEQNLLSQLKLGLDHGDFLFARAPRPSLIVTTTGDYFSIQGARETFESLKPAFAALGNASNIGMIEDDAPHMSTKANRERVYAFFMRAFGIQGSAVDEDIGPIDSDRLRISRTGQVVTSGSRTIYDVIKEDAAPLFAGLTHSRNDIATHRDEVAGRALELSGLDFEGTSGEIVFRGGIKREGYRIEKVIIDAGSNLPLPCLVFVPQASERKPALLFISQEGKEAEAAPGGLVESLVQRGFLVCTPDLPGIGELSGSRGDDDSVIRGVNYNLVFGAQLIGSSITGIQAEAVLRTMKYLADRPDVDKHRIRAVARGSTGPALLHAALRDQNASAFAFIDAPLSWESLFDNPLFNLAQGGTIVPGALQYYDLPDLMGLIAPRKLLLVNPLDGGGKPAEDALHQKTGKIVGPYYADGGTLFSIKNSTGGESLVEILADWLK
jgi:Acetyl xylan esterase (AXE1)